MVRDLNVHIHHGGQFVDTNGKYVGSVEKKSVILMNGGILR
jgi:hypothetical protein